MYSYRGRDHAHVLLAGFLFVDIVRLSRDLLEVARNVMQLRTEICVLKYLVRLLLQEPYLQCVKRPIVTGHVILSEVNFVKMIGRLETGYKKAGYKNNSPIKDGFHQELNHAVCPLN